MSAVHAGIGAKQFATCCEVSYRTIDYWDRTGVLRPSVTTGQGSGTHRRYSADDARVGRALGVLTKHGCAGTCLRRAADELRHKLDGAWSGHVYVDRHGFVHFTMPEAAAWVLDLGWCQRHPCCSAPPLAIAG
jgi:hypothetical protein